jgi:hypothetical protein
MTSADLTVIGSLTTDFENDKRLGEDLLSFAREKLSAGVTNHLKLKYLRVRPPFVALSVIVRPWRPHWMVMGNL